MSEYTYDRQKDYISVTARPNLSIYMQRAEVILGDEQPFLLTTPKVTVTVSAHTDTVLLHIPRGLLREIAKLDAVAEDEMEGEQCWLEEQQYEAMMSAVEEDEAHDRGDDL